MTIYTCNHGNCTGFEGKLKMIRSVLSEIDQLCNKIIISQINVCHLKIIIQGGSYNFSVKSSIIVGHGFTNSLILPVIYTEI